MPEVYLCIRFLPCGGTAALKQNPCVHNSRCYKKVKNVSPAFLAKSTDTILAAQHIEKINSTIVTVILMRHQWLIHCCQLTPYSSLSTTNNIRLAEC
jgi:hypothetical protein